MAFGIIKLTYYLVKQFNWWTYREKIQFTVRLIYFRHRIRRSYSNATLIVACKHRVLPYVAHSALLLHDFLRPSDVMPAASHSVFPLSVLWHPTSQTDDRTPETDWGISSTPPLNLTGVKSAKYFLDFNTSRLWWIVSSKRRNLS